MVALLRSKLSGRLQVTSGVDLLIVLVSFVLFHRIYLGDLNFISERLVVLLTSLVMTYGIFSAAGIYRNDQDRFLHQEFARVTLCWAGVVLFIALVAFLSKAAGEVSRVWVGGASILAYLSMVFARVIHWTVLINSRKRGDFIQPVVVVGANAQSLKAVAHIAENPWTGYRIEAVFDNIASDCLSLPEGRTLDGEISDVGGWIEERRNSGNPISEVWMALPLSAADTIAELMNELRDSSVDICLLPDDFGRQLIGGSISNIAEMPIVNISDIRLPASAELFKRVFDRLISFVALLVLSPLLLAIAVAIKLDSPGPILFKQRRYGMGGREIDVWKFRSMNVMENDHSVKQATRNDVRVTRVGAFLRRNSLDELPQFVNVLQGRMSIVGPRPHAVSQNEEFRQKIDGYMMRHKIKPGITGWAQINGWRGETDTLEKMEKRLQFDLEYIRIWSVWLDLRIIFLTVVSGLRGKDVY